MNKIKRLLVVGGGNSGYIAALMLKTKFPQMQIDMVFSKKKPIMGVGEASTAHLKDFIDFVGIDQYELITETNATFKSYIHFKKWTKSLGNFIAMHVSIDAEMYEKKPVMWLRNISKKSSFLTKAHKLFLKNRLSKTHVLSGKVGINQLQFDTYKLNEFLEKKCLLSGVNILDDEITQVQIDGCGNIINLVGENNEYEYDFYIDSTGQERTLIRNMNSQWKEFDHYIKVNSAFVFVTDELENIPMGTTITGMNCGWMFQIPTVGHTGNGYVYDDRYISDKDAQREIEIIHERKITNGRTIKFTPGYSSVSWSKNCCSVGLSSIFMDPLGATSLGTTIQSIFLLNQYLMNYDEQSIKSYNVNVHNIYMDIRDYVVLHYLNGRKDTPFWIDYNKMTIPDSLKKNLKKWRKKLPTQHDLRTINCSVISNIWYILLLREFDLLDEKYMEKSYHSIPQNVRCELEKYIDTLNGFDFGDTVSHRNALNFIRSQQKIN